MCLKTIAIKIHARRCPFASPARNRKSVKISWKKHFFLVILINTHAAQTQATLSGCVLSLHCIALHYITFDLQLVGSVSTTYNSPCCTLSCKFQLHSTRQVILSKLVESDRDYIPFVFFCFLHKRTVCLDSSHIR